MKTEKRNGVIGGLIWSFGERISAQLVSLIVSVVLARMLDPEHYGILSIVSVFITFLNVFVTGGFGSALIQKKDASKTDFDTAFILSFAVSIVLYFCLFAASPFISNFYQMPELKSLIRVMGLGLPLASINSIQHASIQRSMKFKKFFLSTFSATLISGVVGIVMAYKSLGVWALAGQHLSSTFIATTILFFTAEWKPSLRFSLQSAKQIWSFGWKVLCTRLVSTLEGDIRSLIVGKVFGSADLAYYDQGRKYPAILVNNINSSIDKVMLSAYSKEQDHKEKILSMLRRSVRTGIYILVPILLGFAVVAENFVRVVLTDKWLMCVPFMQVFCISYITRPLESSCHQALLSIGKNKTVLVCMISINTVALATVFVSCFLLESVFSIAVFSLLITLVSLVMFLGFINKNFHYKLKDQLADVLPSMLIGILMCCCVYLVGLLQMKLVLVLILQVLVGAVVYVALSVLFKIEPFMYLYRKIVKKRS